ncbi:MAG TPA: glycosyltransferase family 4 protein [Aquaticitalea sp.]|nr:glycosyltransferase family 4 protein [Aquaticitalea sp.]
MPKKVLIITYYWPPAGGPGVQRWLKFVKYLPDYGIHPVVYIPKNPSYPIIDLDLASEVPENVTIITQKIKEPYGLAKFLSKNLTKTISSGIITKEKGQNLVQRLMLYVRGNYFIPDARKAWVKPSVTYLSGYIRTHGIETIITTGPPHSLHLIGKELKQQLGVKWLADFRDPWTTISYHNKLKLTQNSQKKHKVLEQSVLAEADTIIVTSERTKVEFASKTSQPITVITNGYDTYHLPKIRKDDKFTLAHIGSLLSDRNPTNLWCALKALIDENDTFNTLFRLKLIGIVSEDIIKEIKKLDLHSHVEILGYISHEDVLMEQRQAQLLLLAEIDSEYTKAIIPGKLFEYMVSNTPIIAIGPEGSDVERIIKQTNTGRYFYHSDINGLKSQILEYFEAYKKGTLATNPIGLAPYSRKNLTKTLSELI